MSKNGNAKSLKPLYPDVLGQITGGPRINMDGLEIALGIYPKLAYLNQPMELVLVMQNMIDAEMQLKMALRTPNEDPNGNVVIIEMAKSSVGLTLAPGEVGVFRMPVVARPPTQPTDEIPIRVAIRYRIGEGRRLRPPGGGAPPSVLSVSPFKLQVLREIDFIAHKWNESTDILMVNFGVAPKTLPIDDIPKPRYETLWSQEGLRQEIRLVRAQYDEAMEIANPGALGALYPAMLDAVTERFANRGMPLHPGEAMAIAKMMCYTVEDAPTREPDVMLEDTRWFRSLCHVLAANPELLDEPREFILSNRVFDGIIYDAILMGFRIVESKTDEDMGNQAEQINYANRFMQWFSGHGDADLTYVYLPLVLGGLGIARLVRGGISENPWDISDQLTEAQQGRIDLLSSDNVIIFDMMDSMLDSYTRILRARRVQRPEEIAAEEAARQVELDRQRQREQATGHHKSAQKHDDDEPRGFNRRSRLGGREL